MRTIAMLMMVCLVAGCEKKADGGPVTTEATPQAVMAAGKDEAKEARREELARALDAYRKTADELVATLKNNVISALEAGNQATADDFEKKLRDFEIERLAEIQRMERELRAVE